MNQTSEPQETPDAKQSDGSVEINTVSFVIEDVYARVYRYERADRHGPHSFKDAAHLVVFSESQQMLCELDPQQHGFSPLGLRGLIDAAEAASALTDCDEGRCTASDAHERLKGIDIHYIERSG